MKIELQEVEIGYKTQTFELLEIGKPFLFINPIKWTFRDPIGLKSTDTGYIDLTTGIACVCSKEIRVYLVEVVALTIKPLFI